MIYFLKVKQNQRCHPLPLPKETSYFSMISMNKRKTLQIVALPYWIRAVSTQTRHHPTVTGLHNTSNVFQCFSFSERKRVSEPISSHWLWWVQPNVLRPYISRNSHSKNATMDASRSRIAAGATPNATPPINKSALSNQLQLTPKNLPLR